MKTTRLFLVQSLLFLVTAVYFHFTFFAVATEVHAFYFEKQFYSFFSVTEVYSLAFTAIYYLLGKKTNTVLGLLHFLAALPLIVISYLEQMGIYFRNISPRRYYSAADSIFPDLFPLYGSVPDYWLLGIFFTGQLCFLINLVLVLKKKYQPK